MHPYLILVIAAFSVFTVVLGFYWARQFVGELRRQATPRQTATARRIQAIKASPSSGFSRT